MMSKVVPVAAESVVDKVPPNVTRPSQQSYCDLLMNGTRRSILNGTHSLEMRK